MRVETDIAVVGGGVAGAAAALLLAKQGRSIGLVDAQGLADDWPSSELDPRVIALSPGSAAILESIGAWPLPRPDRVAEYDRMQVCSGRGQVEFLAREHGLDALGWIVEIPALRQALWDRLMNHSGVRMLYPNRVESCRIGDSEVRLELNDGKRLKAGLVIAADGARSPLRSLAGIPLDEWHYNQHALIAPIETEQPNSGIAWQRFTDYGPLAFLPLPDGRSSIVWSQDSARALAQIKQTDDQILDEINQNQDSPMGAAVAIGTRHALPLVRRRARAWSRGRLVLLGDAARSVHPLAGQGLNLGLADAAALAECLDGSIQDVSIDTAMARYQRWRRSASELIGGGIHAINEVFRLPAGLGTHVLGAGFMAAHRLWPAREMLIERACGFDSDSPKAAQRARGG
jgi:ubiquinone biosynthesis UbiH/UbiF/VisC/COQ6 family hydroxylase